jgi:hypothetical protein
MVFFPEMVRAQVELVVNSTTPYPHFSEAIGERLKVIEAAS